MIIFVNNDETTMQELELILSVEERAIELVKIDTNGNIYFEIAGYSEYY